MHVDLSDDIKKTDAYFAERLDRFGAGIRALDYGSRESQQARFDVLLSACDYRGKRVLDIGCGLGDFGMLLRERVPEAKYVGVDICERMVAEAQQRGLEAHHLDICSNAEPPSGDVVIANGVFYLLAGERERKMERLIARMFGLTGEVLIFTSLSNWQHVDDDDEEFRADPMRVLEFCRSLSPSVCLRHDYLPHDFCISLRKPGIA